MHHLVPIPFVGHQNICHLKFWIDEGMVSTNHSVCDSILLIERSDRTGTAVDWWNLGMVLFGTKYMWE